MGHIMTGLALLLARCYKVDGASHQCLFECIGTTHVACRIVLGSLLIPVAVVAGMVDSVEWHELELVPATLVLGIADIYGKLAGFPGRRDALQHILSLADEQRR